MESVGKKLLADAIKRCGQILTKLMKHKHGWIFNTPVDVVGLKLHDYNQIIEQPMDLGTVKSKLGNKVYASPLDFASDVRLTFNNALLYNPKGHDVHVMAADLLARFEEAFGPVYKKYEKEVQAEEEMRRFALEGAKQRGSWARMTENGSRPDLNLATTISNHISHVPINHVPPTPKQAERQEPVAPIARPRPRPPGRTPAGKLPKPKAKEANKRDMTFEEKQRLGLTTEKMDQVLHIMRKRGSTLAQHDDEIEVDIEAMDNDTLWELDRFVCNYKKALTKMKKQPPDVVMAHNSSANEGNKSPGCETNDASMPDKEKAKKSRKGVTTLVAVLRRMLTLEKRSQ
ncbi:hypothetical protein Sjap_022536 [Stephania japonica]|uniref:Uncharacterized protein n=1 Tax=Stephania japonica TaxID=461633 RepID=A0AAP0EPI9_9MAGN